MTTPEYPVVGVGALVFHDHRVLLVRRRHAPNAGQWAIPGGKLHFGETLQQAAEREIFEETGVRIRAAEPVFTFELIEHDDDGSPRLHYVIIDLAATWLGGTPRGGDDAADARWFLAGELAGVPLNETTRRLLNRYPGLVMNPPPGA